jgi:hypothetical protein
VNGAQTTASLAAALRDGSLMRGTVFVPMKLSVVPHSLSEDLIPSISRFANNQNGVKPSDFFANHAFHRRMEEISRRVLTHAVAGSQIQTHWYYERAHPTPQRPSQVDGSKEEPVPARQSTIPGHQEDGPRQDRVLFQSRTRHSPSEHPADAFVQIALHLRGQT